MQLIDVNILIQAHREDADHHIAISKWLVQSLNHPVGVAVSELVLSGTLRIITHPKVFKEPTPIDIAIEFVDDFRSRPNTHYWYLVKITGRSLSSSAAKQMLRVISSPTLIMQHLLLNTVANGFHWIVGLAVTRD